MINKTGPQPSQRWQELKAKFEALCDEQEKIDTTGFAQVYECINEDLLKGNYHNTLWPFTDDEEVLEKALERTGHKADKGFCDRFMSYYRVFKEGKEIQQQMMIQNAKEIQQPQPAEVAGWVFKPMANIIAPVELHSVINDVLKKEALQGMFDSKTDTTAGVDELLDELMMAEAFNVRCNLTHYTEELRHYNIILGDGSFFDIDCTRLLLATLKEALQSIKESSDKPNKLKKDIADIIKRFDNVPVWGIFFQILTLQGLADRLERLDINEGDTGFDEAQAFYNWLFELLIEKEYWFSCVSSMSYGDGDLQRLKPLCEYLMTTTAGQAVQQCIIQPQQQSNETTQPAEPTTGTDTDQQQAFEVPKYLTETKAEKMLLALEGTQGYSNRKVLDRTQTPWVVSSMPDWGKVAQIMQEKLSVKMYWDDWGKLIGKTGKALQKAYYKSRGTDSQTRIFEVLNKL